MVLVALTFEWLGGTALLLDAHLKASLPILMCFASFLGGTACVTISFTKGKYVIDISVDLLPHRSWVRCKSHNHSSLLPSEALEFPVALLFKHLVISFSLETNHKKL
jgi:hypothetical protein